MTRAYTRCNLGFVSRDTTDAVYLMRQLEKALDRMPCSDVVANNRVILMICEGHTNHVQRCRGAMNEGRQ